MLSLLSLICDKLFYDILYITKLLVTYNSAKLLRCKSSASLRFLTWLLHGKYISNKFKCKLRKSVSIFDHEHVYW